MSEPSPAPETKAPPPFGGDTSAVRENRTEWVSWAFGVGAFVVLMVTLFAGRGILTELRDASYARGVITFAICIATISLGFVIVFQALLGDRDDPDNRFRRAREVFAVLMGVLGTVVGFYFGSADREPGILEITSIQVVDAGGGSKRVLAYIAGGTAPYRFDVTLSDGCGKVEKKVSEDGWINEPFRCAVDPRVTIEATDKRNRRASTARDPVSTLTPTPAPTPAPTAAVR